MTQHVEAGAYLSGQSMKRRWMKMGIRLFRSLDRKKIARQPAWPR